MNTHQRIKPIIKVCGMRDAENIRDVESLDIDLMGFIFWAPSKRCVTDRPAYLPTKCKRVGVFVNETLEQVIKTANEYQLDYIQLHGKESPVFLLALRVAQERITVSPRLIKAFNIATTEDLELTEDYEGIADYFLFDTKGRSVGGNGEQFDWSILSDYHGNTPFLLSGGIGPDDAERIKAFFHEKCIGIDLNSRFETAPGLKDVTTLRSFLTQLTHEPHQP
jgi:phosphoribosylanthranilate isomerase